ncbi:ribonuclease H-like domain-containing protein [Tanacetum coccineum]
MWEIRIKQEVELLSSIQDYALWEVIENGNSWVPIPVTTPESGPSTACRMTVPSPLARNKICKQRMIVKARTYVDAQSMFIAIKARFGGNDATKKTQKALLKQQYENFNATSSESLDSIFNRLQKLVKRTVAANNDDKNLAFLTTSSPSSTNTINTVNTGVSTGNTKVNTASTETSTASFSDAIVFRNGSKVEYGTAKHKGKKQNGAGFDWSDMAEDEIQANMALMAFTDSEVSNDKSCSKSCLQNYEALKKQYDDLLVKLDDTAFKAATYKRGLSILEAQGLSNGLVKTELEKVKEEKEGFEFKLAKFEKSSKDLDDLLASQVTDKSKRGFGYNAVPSPHPLILNRPTPLDLSYSGLEEFKQPEARENTDAPIIEDWVSDDEEEVESIPKEEKKTDVPTATKKESVKTVKPSRRLIFQISKTLMEVMLLLVEEQMEEESLVKLPDEFRYFLNSRQINMYSFDMKNIIPKDGLTYLVAKATSEESMLWHRRLGHVNFKNINKLVKKSCILDVSETLHILQQDKIVIIMPIWKDASLL